jgi:metal-responsive CopG/Arc/MetJ family transcriptional regulator
MVTISFSIPEELNNAFNETFEVHNQSVIISDLMRQAIQEEKRKRQRTQAIDTLLAIRKSLPPFTEQEIRRAREENRP